MTDISSKILKEIKAHDLKPKPKWKFQLRESGIWSLIGIVTILFGLVASLFWLFTAEIDLGPLAWLTGRPLMYGRGPGSFLIILAIGIVFLLWNIRHTKHGYRYNLGLIILSLFGVGLVLASAFGYFGLNGRLDRSLSGMPMYQTQQQYMLSVWQRPSEGRILGEITAIEDKNNFSLRDSAGNIWSVSSSGATWRHNLEPETGLQIKIVGVQSGRNGFEATDIRPFMPSDGGCGMATNGAKGQGGCGMMR